MASFDENGKYIKTNWKAGDKITATKLNKIEESIEDVNDNDISRHAEADARLDALEAKDVAHDKEFTNVKNLIADNKAAAELGDYEINSRMQFLEQELNEGIEEVHNVAEIVDGKIAKAEADMTAMVAEVEADLEGLHAKDEELNSQLAHIESNQSALKVSNFGSEVDALRVAIRLGNEKKIPVDIDVPIVLPTEWTLDDMIDVKTNVFSSVGVSITYSKYGIPIFLVRENNIEFGRGIEFYWNGITPSTGTAPQSWGELKTAMKFDVSYNYNKNTSTAPLVFLGVDGKCFANFTSATDDNLIYNCIAVLPKTATSRHSFYIDSVFDGIIFGLNSQNFNGLHGRVKGKRYGNLASSGVAPGHLIYLTSVGSDLPVWSTDIDIYCDDTEAICVTDGLVQDDVSIKFLSSESIRVFVASNRPHGALDMLGVRDVEFTCFSDRQINRRGNEYSPFAFRIQGGNFNNHITNTKDCYNIRGSVVYNIIDHSIERGALVTGTYSKIGNTIIDYLCNCDVNARKIGTITGDNSKHDFKLSMNSSSVYNDDDVLLNISGDSYNEKLSISIEFLNETKNRFRITQGNVNIGDVTVIDKNSTLKVDNNIKRVVERKLSTFQNRVSGASTTPITIPHYLITGNYEIEIESVSDNLNSFYKCTYFLVVNGNNYVINKIKEYGTDGLKWTPSVLDNNLIITPSTTQSSNYKVIIVKS